MGLLDFLLGKASKDIIQREIDAYNRSVAAEEELRNLPLSNELIDTMWAYIKSDGNDERLRDAAARSAATLADRVAEYKQRKAEEERERKRGKR